MSLHAMRVAASAEVLHAAGRHARYLVHNVSSTGYKQGTIQLMYCGSCMTDIWGLGLCRVAKSSMSSQQCLDNIIAVVESALEHIPKKWTNVQALHLKSANSVALPVYQTLPVEDVTRIQVAQ